MSLRSILIVAAVLSVLWRRRDHQPVRERQRHRVRAVDIPVPDHTTLRRRSVRTGGRRGAVGAAADPSARSNDLPNSDAEPDTPTGDAHLPAGLQAAVE